MVLCGPAVLFAACWIIQDSKSTSPLKCTEQSVRTAASQPPNLWDTFYLPASFLDIAGVRLSVRHLHPELPQRCDDLLGTPSTLVVNKAVDGAYERRAFQASHLSGTVALRRRSSLLPGCETIPKSLARLEYCSTWSPKQVRFEHLKVRYRSRVTALRLRTRSWS